VAEAHRAEPVDLRHLVLAEAAEEVAQLGGVPLLHPALAIRFRCSLEDGPVGVAAHEGRVRERRREPVRLRRLRAPRQVAAEDDEVGLLAVQFREHRGQGGRVPVHVGKDGDPQASRAPWRGAGRMP
jgi:hypothetical protein